MALLVLTVAAGVVAGIAGAPLALVALATSAIGGALVASRMRERRLEGASALAGEDLQRYPLRLAAERVAVGPTVQPRFLPKTRAVWAPGVLCVDRGDVRFVPSNAKHADRAWHGSAAAVQVLGLAGSSAVVRILQDGGAQPAVAQFVVLQPAPAVTSALGHYVEVTTSARS